ncbi:MAG: diguanylate cyclase [Clostridia bacterium]
MNSKIVRFKNKCRDKLGKNKHWILLLLTLLLTLLIVLVSINVSEIRINNERNAIFETKWRHLDSGETTLISLPAEINVSKNSPIILTNTLPNEIIDGVTILVTTVQQDVRLYVNDKLIYTTFIQGESNPTSAVHLVRLPIDSAGAEIKVILSSPYSHYSGAISQIYIGSKAANMFFLVKHNSFQFIIGFLLNFVGILLTALLVFSKTNIRKAPVIYLGAFFVVAGFWLMTQSKLLQFIFPFPTAITLASIFSLTLWPVFLGFYLHYKMYGRKLKLIQKYISIFSGVLSIIYAVIICFSPSISIKVFPTYVIILSLIAITEAFLVIIECVKTKTFFAVFVFGIVGLATCVLIQFVLFLTNLIKYDSSLLLTIGLFVFCLAMLFDSIHRFSRVYQNSNRADTLSLLAYTDGLTGVKNRTAFLERVNGFNINTVNAVSVIMFDINNLKVINDSLGHFAGDTLLLHCVDVIKKCLQPSDTLYRVGGDEFVAIILHSQDLDLEDYELHFEEKFEQEIKKSPEYQLNIAYGFATYSSLDRGLCDTVTRADEKMYLCKKKQKEIAENSDLS